MTRCVIAVSVVGLLGVVAPRLASARDIPCQPVDAGVIFADGLLGDWQGVTPQKFASGAVELDVMCNYSSDTLYLALQVHEGSVDPDAKLSVDLGHNEMGIGAHGNLSVGHPSEWSGPNAPDPSGVKIVTAQLIDGIVSEMQLPLSTAAPGPVIPFAATVVTKGTTLSTSTNAPHQGPIDRLELASGAANLDAFLQQVGATRADVTWDHVAPITQDGGLQRVVLVHNVIGLITAENYQYVQLPVDQASDITGIDLVDLAGDGRDWILVRYTQRGEGGSRDILAAYRTSGDSFVTPWAHEVEKKVGDNVLMDDWQYAEDDDNDGSDIVVSSKPPTGFTQATYQETPATDVIPIVLPWPDAKKTERFTFDGITANLVQPPVK
jgi:hypothetical protein